MPHLSLLEIHNALATASRPSHPLEEAPTNNNPNAVDQQILQAVKQGQGTSIFHETLHEYSLFARPATAADISSLFQHVNKLIRLCGIDAESWKVLVLTVFLRRYHEKAPEAKKMKSEDDSNRSVGDGERLVFYGTLLEMHHFWHENPQAQLAYEAAASMIRIAAQIGGTRDLCSIIEHLTLANLKRADLLDGDGDAAPESFADKLVPAVQAIAMDGNSPPDGLLELALRLAAQQLDQDLLLLGSEKEDKEGKNVVDFISTIHVMIPHNQRGSNTKNGWRRKLANSLAEILIWQRTNVAQKDVRFCNALNKLKALPSGPPTDQSYKLIQQLQTSVRKQRQLLNSYARERGFMSTSSYQLDKTSLTLRQIRRAKVGDLKQLQKLARKNEDEHILKLIAKRGMDPDKATAIESIQELANGWVDTRKDYGENDEIAVLELAMQINTVQATLNKLRCQATRPVLVTCVGIDRDNLLCAILVAACLENSRLVLAGSEHDVSTIEKCVDLLNQEITNGRLTMDDPRSLSLEDILATKLLRDSQDAIILASRDLELDEKVLKDLQARDITLRVHATKKVETCGDVQLSLNSAIYDRIKAREPFSLSVVLDCTGSMGEEIEGCKKGALKLISTFHELAPVQSANVLGYWDPVNVRTDPQPKSTGFLDTADEGTSKALQEFVNTQLVCQGGGDEPEDIPKALEHLLDDMKKKGLSADSGVHMVFFIADAGFRANENTRVQRAFDALKKLGIVLVMCSVRGGGSLEVFMDRARDCFQGAGQYVELSGVGQLESIASIVTESIRASLFQSSVVSVTASIGSTIDSIRKLVSFQEDHEKLKETVKLTKLADEDEEMDKVEVFASKELTLTSRDQLYLQLSRLPAVCHMSVGKAFGGKSLKEMSAAAIAERLRSEEITLAEVKKKGYPDDVVDLVRDLMSGFGVKRAVADPPQHWLCRPQKRVTPTRR